MGSPIVGLVHDNVGQQVAVVFHQPVMFTQDVVGHNDSKEHMSFLELLVATIVNVVEGVPISTTPFLVTKKGQFLGPGDKRNRPCWFPFWDT